MSIKTCPVCQKQFNVPPSIAIQGKGIYCSYECRRKACGPVARFWKNVNKDGAYNKRLKSNCWEWTGAKVYKYGSMSIYNRSVRAHRYSWEIRFGKIPKGKYVCHHCDNPSCVNPDHLYLGTPQDNMTDKVERGRHRVPVGERHGNARLTNETVIEMRQLYANGGHTHKSLAEMFGVSTSAAQCVIERKTWKHV